ncbi:MAG: hypothetical protein FWC42_05495 [Proteobacteria bacterium]|nr:hypothetical protein [Pseudomonadota bacterium]
MSTPETNPNTQTNIPTITRCSAERGWLWWVESFRMIKEAPGAWYRIGLGYIGVFIVPVLLLSLVAMIDERLQFITYLANIFAPFFVVGFVAAGWTQARGGTPKFSHLFSGFKADVKTLLGIGGATMVLTVLSLLISMFVLGGNFVTEMENLSENNDPMAVLEFLTSPRLWLAILVFATLLTLIWMATWLAPMVVVFQHAGVVRALRSSFKAVSVNWRALLMWGLVLLAGSSVIGMVLVIVMMVLMLPFLAIGGESSALIVMALFVGLELFVLPLLIGLGILSSFVAYCDIFHAKDAVFPRPPKA